MVRPFIQTSQMPALAKGVSRERVRLIASALKKLRYEFDRMQEDEIKLYNETILAAVEHATRGDVKTTIEEIRKAMQ